MPDSFYRDTRLRDIFIHCGCVDGRIGANEPTPADSLRPMPCHYGLHVTRPCTRHRGRREIVCAGHHLFLSKLHPCPFREENFWEGSSGQNPNASYGLAEAAVARLMR